METLRREKLLSRFDLLAETVAPEPWIEQIHSENYIERLRAACENDLPFIDCPDSAICPDSEQVARRAVGKVLAACDAVLSGRADNAFCAVRPPGHHAERDRSMGFCLYNNVAVAARYLQQRHGLGRVLILDWDMHHGNGTQHSFEADDTVFYASLHQHPATAYPGTGWASEVGVGPGRGYTLNVPLEPGTGDEECLVAFGETMLPVMREFRPDFVLLSAGFDAHRKDPLGQLNWSENAFAVLTQEMLRLADEHCQGRLVSVLEGGYQLGVLSTCVATHLRGLLTPKERWDLPLPVPETQEDSDDWELYLP